MAQPAEQVLIQAEIGLTAEQVEKLCASVEIDMPVSHKISGLARGALESLADGGVMLRPDEVTQISQSIDEQVTCAEDILPYIEMGAGRKGGKLSGFWEVDPQYEPIIQEKADFQGINPQDVINRVINEVMDQGWVLGDVIPQPERVLMSREDREALVDVLGSDFENGTQLAKLIKEHLGLTTSPFAEPHVAPLGK